jgi:hypothetical protein
MKLKNWLLLNILPVLWSIHRVRLSDWVPDRHGQMRLRSDERLYLRASRILDLSQGNDRSRRLAAKILRYHSSPIHALRAVLREQDDAVLEQSRRAWAEVCESGPRSRSSAS